MFIRTYKIMYRSTVSIFYNMQNLLSNTWQLSANWNKTEDTLVLVSICFFKEKKKNNSVTNTHVQNIHYFKEKWLCAR